MRKTQRLVHIALLGLGLGLAAAQAGVISTLFSTGVDPLGNPLAGGVPDLHYTLSGPYGGPFAFVTNSPAALGWIGNTATSQWIDPDGNGGNGTTGAYTYTTTFDLTGFAPATAEITGLLAGDDSAIVFLNGTQVAATSPAAWFSYAPIDITTGFVGGVNTLAFSVLNTSGPTGLQAQLLGTASPVPEPRPLAVLGLGLVIAMLGRRRGRA